MTDFEIKVEVYVSSPLKSIQKNALLDEFSKIIIQNNGKINTQNSLYVEKRSADIPLTLVYSLGISASILAIVNAVLGISKNLGNSKKSEIFVKRNDGNYVKVTEEMDADKLKKQLEK